MGFAAAEEIRHDRERGTTGVSAQTDPLAVESRVPERCPDGIMDRSL
jgi:hypothetical protein